MSFTRLAARSMLSTVSVLEGMESLRNPGSQAEATRALATRAGWAGNPELLVRINGAVQVTAGILLAVGKLRRLSALTLIGTTCATTYVDNRFWAVEDPEDRARQRANFLKRVGLIGGLMLEVVDTEGAPSLKWRARRASEHARSVISSGSESASARMRPVTRRGGRRAARIAAIGVVRSRAGVVATAGHAADEASDRLKAQAEPLPMPPTTRTSSPPLRPTGWATSGRLRSGAPRPWPPEVDRVLISSRLAPIVRESFFRSARIKVKRL